MNNMSLYTWVSDGPGLNCKPLPAVGLEPLTRDGKPVPLKVGSHTCDVEGPLDQKRLAHCQPILQSVLVLPAFCLPLVLDLLNSFRELLHPLLSPLQISIRQHDSFHICIVHSCLVWCVWLFSSMYLIAVPHAVIQHLQNLENTILLVVDFDLWWDGARSRVMYGAKLLWGFPEKVTTWVKQCTKRLWGLAKEAWCNQNAGRGAPSSSVSTCCRCSACIDPTCRFHSSFCCPNHCVCCVRRSSLAAWTSLRAVWTAKLTWACRSSSCRLVIFKTISVGTAVIGAATGRLSRGTIAGCLCKSLDLDLSNSAEALISTEPCEACNSWGPCLSRDTDRVRCGARLGA